MLAAPIAAVWAAVKWLNTAVYRHGTYASVALDGVQFGIDYVLPSTSLVISLVYALRLRLLGDFSIDYLNEWDENAARSDFERLVRTCSRSILNRYGIIQGAFDDNWRLRRESDSGAPLRFDERRKGAHAVNRRLDQLESKIDEQRQAVYDYKYGICSQIEWEPNYIKWRSRLRRYVLFSVVPIPNFTVCPILIKAGASPYGSLALSIVSSATLFSVIFLRSIRRIDTKFEYRLKRDLWQPRWGYWNKDPLEDIPDYEYTIGSHEEATKEDFFGEEEDGKDDVGEAASEALGDRWFDILEVDEDAPIADIKKSFRNLIQQYHPDRLGDVGERVRLLAEAETRRLNSAYATALQLRKSKS